MSPSSARAGTHGSQAGRRSQAERSATTRRAILDAAIACIDEDGFTRATTQRIARSAGMTVGAVQHHFPAKTELLAAILEESADRLVDCFADLELSSEADVDERARVFARRAWRHYGSAFFRATHEILLYSRRGSTGGPRPMAEDWAIASLAASGTRAREIFRSIFGGPGLSGEDENDLLRFAFAMLTGLALMKRIEGRESAMVAQIGLFERSLADRVREATGSSG